IAVWKQLPDEVPTHFSLRGAPNGYTGKYFLWLLSAINLFAYFILQRVNMIDPKRQNKKVNSSIDKLSKGLLLFLTALNILVIIVILPIAYSFYLFRTQNNHPDYFKEENN